MPHPDQPGLIHRAFQTQPEKWPQSSPGPPPVPKVRALEFVRRMRGASLPCLLRCEDGANYVVKFQNNPQHVRVLANELLASRLALLIGLPVPSSAFVEVPPQLLEADRSLEPAAGSRGACGPELHFGSRFPGIPGQTLVVDFLPDRLLRRVQNLPSAFLGALVFDKWTCNCDGRQVIFYRSAEEPDSFYSASLIDHGFCFNDGEWNFPDNPIRSLYPRRLVYEKVRGLESFEPFLSAVENLDAAELQACLREVPAAWCGADAQALLRLGEELHRRRRRVRQAIIDARNSALRPFPNWV